VQRVRTGLAAPRKSRPTRSFLPSTEMELDPLFAQRDAKHAVLAVQLRNQRVGRQLQLLAADKQHSHQKHVPVQTRCKHYSILQSTSSSLVQRIHTHLHPASRYNAHLHSPATILLHVKSTPRLLLLLILLSYQHQLPSTVKSRPAKQLHVAHASSRCLTNPTSPSAAACAQLSPPAAPLTTAHTPQDTPRSHTLCYPAALQSDSSCTLTVQHKPWTMLLTLPASLRSVQLSSCHLLAGSGHTARDQPAAPAAAAERDH
jgi:hypothetical protein